MNQNVILFVDSSVDNAQSLLDGAVSGVETRLLSPNQDGIAQITEFLQQNPETSTIHIVSHGAPGCLYLGNGQVNLSNLVQYQAILGNWNVDQILLYGCNVASGDAGEEFITKLHQFTGANISATATLTGNTALGGNWDLEVKFPKNEDIYVIFREETLASYQGIFVLNTLLSDNFNIENGGTGSYNYENLANWTITDGSIDLVGNNYDPYFPYEYFPSNGLYLDLDGTTGNASRLESKSTFNFNAGDTVTLSFSLAGSQRSALQNDLQDSVTVSLGGLFIETFTLPNDQAFTQFTRTFTVSSPTSGNLVFDHAGGDNIGLLLDNVLLTANQGTSNNNPTDIYFNDFETAAGSQWSNQTRAITPYSPTNFLGEFNNETVSLTLNDSRLANADVTLEFDLFIINSWDGSGPIAAGPDLFTLSVEGGPTLLSETFSNTGWAGNEQSYSPSGSGLYPSQTGATAVDTLFGGAIYHLSYTISSASDLLTFNFAASGLQDIWDESWGLDNVRVSVAGNIPNPSLTGTPDDDTFVIDSSGNNTIDGLDGFDTVDYSQLQSDITLKSRGILDKGDFGIDNLQNIEAIIANADYDNTIDASDSTTNRIQADLSQNSLTVFGLPSGDITIDVTNFQNITGGQADDVITGNDDDNTLNGKGGDDTFFATNGNDIVTGGTGYDIADYSQSANPISVQAGGVIDKGEAGIDQVSVEEIIANPNQINEIDFSDSTSAITVNLVNNTLNSLIVQNITNVTGSTKADTIIGDEAKNILNGGLGADILNGGSGIDTASYVNAVSGVTVNLATGKGSLGEATGDTLTAIENLTGSAFNDNLAGNSAVNVLNGGAGNDVLTGGAGNDSLIGGNGNDILNGGLGVDTLNGGNGIDTATYANAASAVAVSLVTGKGTLGESLGDVLTYIENLTGSNYNDSLTGNNLNNTLTGNNGNDTLTGGAGIDTLLGGAGNDTLVGGMGNDILTGGTGLDKFQFNASNEGIDVIKDFSVVDDTIVVKASGFGSLSAGTLAAAAFRVGSGFTNSSQRFVYNSSTGALLFDRDGNGGGFATTQIATLNTGLALTNADFLVV